MTFIQEIRRRWREESPDVFKKIRSWCKYVALLSGALVALDMAGIEFIKSILPDFAIPYFDQVMRMALVFSTGAGIVAKLPVKNPDDLARPGDSPGN